MKRPSLIIGGLTVGVIGLVIYVITRTPSDITPQSGEGSETVAWISLAIAVLSLATALVGLIHKLVELRGTKG